MGKFSKGLTGEKYLQSQSVALTRAFDRAYKDLLGELKSREGTLWQKGRANQMKKQLEITIKDLEKIVDRFTADTIQTVYFDFAKDAQNDLKKLGYSFSDEFSQIHTKALQVLVDDANLKFATAMEGVKRSVNVTITNEMKIAIREIAASGQIRGLSTKKIAAAVKNEFMNKGITAMVDRGGREWSLGRYAKMLSEQLLAESSRMATDNVALENDFDVVKITNHSSKHDECAVWENQYLSLTGKTKGLDTLDDAIGAGLFHVGCLHGRFIATDYKG